MSRRFSRLLIALLSRLLRRPPRMQCALLLYLVLISVGPSCPNVRRESLALVRTILGEPECCLLPISKWHGQGSNSSQPQDYETPSFVSLCEFWRATTPSIVAARCGNGYRRRRRRSHRSGRDHNPNHTSAHLRIS